ncbi:hypothetical protein [Arthrobacter sp. SLBN-100]|uniref:hypothetical protein n=1 Tax=Arthrobacter sp. SLBN-100 TaxID=2768450 RepID=UPI00115397F3|nr:hypothetical protein [Arthrobacter sp. SLBN-100]
MERSTTAAPARRARLGRLPLAAAVLASVVTAGCSVGVPDPSAPQPVETPSVLATPTITPGHDAEAVAAQDLPFASGGTLASGVPVGISDGLKDAPGWKMVKDNVAGESQYLKADGCLVAAKVRTNQAVLAQGDDRESTVALFQYLDSTILPEYLKAATLRWGGDESTAGHAVEVLVLEEAAAPGGRATTVLARLFGTSGSSIYVSVSCPDASALAAARADAVRFLPVLPPSA